MFRYVIKRFLYFIPTLFVISLLTFALSKVAPGDPVELRLQGGMQSQSGGQQEMLQSEQTYIDLSEKMGLNLPTFYMNIASSAYPDTLYKIHRKHERDNLNRLIHNYGNWDAISEYHKSVKGLETALFGLTKDSTNTTRIRIVRENCNELYRSYEDGKINALIGEIDTAIHTVSRINVDSTIVERNTMAAVIPAFTTMRDNYQRMKSDETTYKKYIPAFHWYGLKNQYHRWLFGNAPWFSSKEDPSRTAKGFFRGDFGESFLDGRPVKSILIEGVRWTMTLNIIAVLLAYLIAIPLGVETAVKKDTSFDRISTTLLFILYSLPSFWIATLLIVFMTTNEYGMDFFPTYGVGSSDITDDTPFWTRFWDTAYHLILPVFCLTYGSFAFISRQMRGGMLSVIQQDYIRTAKAKGLDKSKIIWKHAFRNSLIPIITLFASLLPLMISGSVIIEYIFNIPGMGRISYEAVIARNYPVLYTVLMFAAILTMIGILIADLLYAVVDPRISYSKKA